METKEDNEKLMIRYLLGEMSEPEQGQVEERYFHDQDFYLQLLAVEEELMGDYARGHLSPPERAQFEQHFLASPHRQQKYESAKEWLDFISSASLPATVPPIKERRSWFKDWRFPSLAFQATLAAAMLMMTAGSVWLLVQTRGLQAQLKQSEIQRATLEQQAQESRQQAGEQRARNEQLAAELARQRQQLEQIQSSPVRSPGTESSIAFLILNDSGTRNIGEESKLVIPSDADSVRLQLNFETNDYLTYRAVLQTVAGEERWRSKDQLKARATNAGGRIVLELPASLFTKRDYIMLLNGITAAGGVETVGRYSFKVDKK